MRAVPAFYLCIDCGGSKTSAALSDPSGNVIARARSGPSNFSYIGFDAFLTAIGEATGRALADALSLPASNDNTPGILFPVKEGTDAKGRIVPSHTLAAAWLGVSGVDSQAAIDLLTPLVSTFLGIPPTRVAITNDVLLLGAPLRMLSAADVAVESAVAVIGGTGSIVMSLRAGQTKSNDGKEGGREPLVELARMGGWGWILGDEGGGFDVGRTALRTLLTQRGRESAGAPVPAFERELIQEERGGKKKLKGLKERVLRRFGVDDILELLRLVHLPDPGSDIITGPPQKRSDNSGDAAQPQEASSAERTKQDEQAETPNKSEETYDYTSHSREQRLSDLSPLVFTAAFEDGDPLAMGVIQDCAGKLAEVIETVLLPVEAGTAESLPHHVPARTSVLCLGGSLVSLANYRALVLSALEKKGHVFAQVEVIEDAAGAGAKGLVGVWEGK